MIIALELGSIQDIDLLYEVVERIIKGEPKQPYDNLVLITLKLSLDVARVAGEGHEKDLRFSRGMGFPEVFEVE